MWFGLFLSFLISVVFASAIRFKLDSVNADRPRSELLTEYILTHSMGWFLVVWVFFFGACLGSFLNVVAFRIPSGLTIIGNSRCPWCLVPIEGRFNLPILGWLILRGRCKACRLPIAVRYMVVEVIAGCLLVWLFAFELVSDGANLPGNVSYKIDSLFRVLASGRFEELPNNDWSLLLIFAIHVIVAYTILTAALMRLDRFRLPATWRWIHLTLVFVMIGIWPGIFEFAQADFQVAERLGSWFARVDLQLTGMCMGAVLGFQFQQTVGDRHSGLLFAFLLLGCSCGYAATLSIGVVFLSALGIAMICRVGPIVIKQPLFIVLSAFLIQVAGWNLFDRLTYWPNPSASSGTLIAFLLPSAFAVVLAQNIRSRKRQNLASDR